MNRRRLLFVIGLLALLGGGVFLMLPRKTTPLRLTIVRQTAGQEEPVVYFRVEAGRGRPIMLNNFERVYDGTIDTPGVLLTIYAKASDARQEFGVSTPKFHEG